MFGAPRWIKFRSWRVASIITSLLLFLRLHYEKRKNPFHISTLFFFFNSTCRLEGGKKNSIDSRILQIVLRCGAALFLAAVAF